MSAKFFLTFAKSRISIYLLKKTTGFRVYRNIGNKKQKESDIHVSKTWKFINQQ